MLPRGQSLVLEEILVLVRDEQLRRDVVNQLIDEGAVVHATYEIAEAVNQLVSGNYTFLICDKDNRAGSLMHAVEASGAYPLVLVDVYDVDPSTIYGKGPEIIFFAPCSPTPLDNLSPLRQHVRNRGLPSDFSSTTQI